MKAVIMAENEEKQMPALVAGHHNAAETTRLQTGEPLLRKPVFGWNAEDKYVELKSFETEVTTIFLKSIIK